MAAKQHAIFIGYRREDSGDTAGRVYDHLETTFGKKHVFKDVDSIPVGEDFRTYVATVIKQCRVFLPLIGPRWLEVRHQGGGRRLDDPEDLVRIEIETALATPGVQIVPLLVGGAAMPSAADLPVSLRKLADLNAAQARRDPDFRFDMDRLTRDLAPFVRMRGKPQKGPRKAGWLRPAAAVVAVVVLALVGFFVWDGLPRPLEPRMVSISGGRFQMGSPSAEVGRSNEETQRWIDVPSFLAGQYEVTEAEWRECNKDGACEWNGGYFDAKYGDFPVVVTWDVAQGYISWLNQKFPGKNYRLLTEAEWEYAARGGTRTAYSWGDQIGKGNANCRGCGSPWDETRTHAGSFKPNPFGLFDMAGNESEWVQDCYVENYAGAPVDGAAFETPSCENRVVRGGNNMSFPDGLRSASRGFYIEGTEVGFRLARSS